MGLSFSDELKVIQRKVGYNLALSIAAYKFLRPIVIIPKFNTGRLPEIFEKHSEIFLDFFYHDFELLFEVTITTLETAQPSFSISHPNKLESGHLAYRFIFEMTCSK